MPDVSRTSESPVLIPEDEIESGLAPLWVVHYGDPLIENGWLASNVGTGIAAGDHSWKNYRIEFEVDTSETDCAFTDNANSLGTRVDPFDRAYWFLFTGCEAAWSLYPGGIFQGVEVLIPKTRVQMNPGEKHITIEGTKLSAFEGVKLLSSIENKDLAAGGIFLQLDTATRYHRSRVKLLP